MSLPLCVAAFVAVLTFLVHGCIGSREVVPPLLAAGLPRGPKLTLYFCWHLVTLVLAVLAAALGYMAFFEPTNHSLAAVCLALSLGAVAWNLGLVVGRRATNKELPAWTLFSAIAASIVWHLTGT